MLAAELPRTTAAFLQLDYAHRAASPIPAVLRAAMRWTSASGMQELGHLPGANFSAAIGTSSDGTIAVGYSSGSTQLLGVFLKRALQAREPGLTISQHLSRSLWVPLGMSSDGIYTMDRGMDDRKVFSYLSSRHLSFAIRLIGNRLVTGPGADTLLAASLAARYKGKFSASFISKNGNHRQICFSAIPVQIPSIPEQTYVMLVVKGYSFKPLLLLCNPSSLHKDVLLHFIQAYIARWNIEEIFRYRKVSSALESIQVRSLRSIFAMNLLAMLAAAFATTLCISKACRQLYWFLFDQAQRERRRTFPFPVYAIADGIRAVLSRFRCGIRHLAQLSRRPPTLQQLMFPQITQLCAFQVS